MSKKNKLVFKACRRDVRGENFPRTPVSQPAQTQIATKILTNPKYKVSAKTRRKLSLRRGVLVEVERKPATHPSVKLALKLSKLSLVSLYHRLAQSARRASTIKEILLDMVPGSQLSAPLEAEHINQIGIFKQVKAEINSRTV